MKLPKYTKKSDFALMAINVGIAISIGIGFQVPFLLLALIVTIVAIWVLFDAISNVV